MQWPGCEHLDLSSGLGRVTADGAVIAVVDDVPLRLYYRVRCDASWTTTSVEIDLYGHPPVRLTRRADDRWYEADGSQRPDLTGCVDVDIALTPFTNTLPIRRLGLEPGESADLRMVYIQVEPTLEINAADQRYVKLAPGAEADYRYQSGSFVADLVVDHDGIVVDYPGLWVLRHG